MAVNDAGQTTGKQYFEVIIVLADGTSEYCLCKCTNARSAAEVAAIILDADKSRPAWVRIVGRLDMGDNGNS